jgi:hypothetical protein
MTIHQLFTGQSAEQNYGFLNKLLCRKGTVVPISCVNLRRIKNTGENLNRDG